MRGGSRPGAGRPAGAANRKTREVADKAAAEGVTPLEFLLSVMREEGREFQARLDAAKAAAPYVHARLATVEHKGNEDAPLQTVTRIELVAPPHDDSAD